MRRFIPLICLCSVFIPLAVTSTPPGQGPLTLRSYRLNGTLLDSRGEPLAGRTVAFAVPCQSGYLLLDLVNGCTCSQGERRGRPSAVTTPDGAFSLDLVSCQLFDSLAVAIVEPIHPIITKHVVAVKDARQEEWNEQVPNQDTSYFFCATTTGYSTVRIGVAYDFSSRTVALTSNGSQVE